MGTTNSAIAVLAVNLLPPTITNQLLSQILNAGQTAVFLGGATGSPTLGCQWAFNGVDLAGATAPRLTITNVQAANAGSYVLTVTNAAGSISSVTATLTIAAPGTLVFVESMVSATTSIPILLTRKRPGVGRHLHSS